MSAQSDIQWCDSAVNPIAGCTSQCELKPTVVQVRKAIAAALAPLADKPEMETAVRSVCGDHDITGLWQLQESITAQVCEQVGADAKQGTKAVRAALQHIYKCYALKQHFIRGGDIRNPLKRRNLGYARNFEKPEMFPGRMAEAASWSDLRGLCRPDKPWADGLPRMVFISDLGDAMSEEIPFEFLHDEIICAVTSPQGQRHQWQWPSKQPKRQAEFSRWLEARGIPWPNNLWAMTTITSKKTLWRLKDILDVPAVVRGLSIEPLWGPITLPLSNISWVILGGESGTEQAEPFDLAWARNVRDQCRDSGVACFIKQMGRNPVADGQPVTLLDAHGGDWSEWPRDLRVREFPLNTPASR